MKDTDYLKLVHFKNVGGGFIPANDKCEELMLSTLKNEIIAMLPCTKRDVSFHRCYMALLSFIWGYMPLNFRNRIPNKIFYIWLKHLKKQYEVQYSFIDDEKISDILDTCTELGLTHDQTSTIAARFGKTDMLEYDSISFGRMDEKKFKEYVANQLPWIYENVIGIYFNGEMFDSIVNTIEQEFIRFLDKLP